MADSYLNTIHIEFGRHLYGGALQVVYLMRGLIERGHKASLLCAKGSAIEKEAMRGNIPVYPICIISDSDPTIALRVCSVIRRVKPDVVHLHSRRGADLFGGLGARMARVPAVILSRRVDDSIELGMIGRLKFNTLPDRIVAISDGIRKVLLSCSVDGDKVEMVHSAVVSDSDVFRRDRGWLKSEFGIPEDAPVIGTIAQLIERKGHKYLFAAIPEILKEFPSARFLMLGEGPIRADLEAYVSDLGVGNTVIFAGFRTDIARILPNLDLLVHPALREGLGVCLLQAASAGLPIVATEAGGIPEIVRNEETGLLIPPEDSDAVACSVLRLLRDKDLSGILGENARRIVETEFSVENMVEGNIRVYNKVLGLGAS